GPDLEHHRRLSAFEPWLLELLRRQVCWNTPDRYRNPALSGHNTFEARPIHVQWPTDSLAAMAPALDLPLGLGRCGPARTWARNAVIALGGGYARIVSSGATQMGARPHYWHARHLRSHWADLDQAALPNGRIYQCPASIRSRAVAAEALAGLLC